MIRTFTVLALAALPAAAHDGVVHATQAEALAHQAQTDAAAAVGPATPFPLALGGPFKLTDQHGEPRTERDPDGRPQLLFFGYANCQAICSVALPLMAEVADAVSSAGVEVTPVMITVDPSRDTVEALGAPLAEHHADFVGLTGAEGELAAVYDAYSVEHKVVFEDPEYGPVYAHGSHIYLLDAEGTLLTLVPPILSAERAAEIVLTYVR